MAQQSEPNGSLISIPSPTLPGQVIKKTIILPVRPERIAHIQYYDRTDSFLTHWGVMRYLLTPDAEYIQEAGERLREGDHPVAFPTETVYGLGADATRSTAVRGIYMAKGRPADNPLIVHVCSLEMLRSILKPSYEDDAEGLEEEDEELDPIPPIYKPLINRFWPGPLTILLPNPPDSPLAPEVTAGLPTFGARMPSSLLALLLIWSADVPVAAPSANASGKPSPTTAQHVKDDLDGRIELILDGGPCTVGVESTVVDGLCYPPAILRPGGIGIDQLKECPGWEDVVIGYKDSTHGGGSVGMSTKNGGSDAKSSEENEAPRAPGMKYRHYAPKAKVILVEYASNGQSSQEKIMARCVSSKLPVAGVLRTTKWVLPGLASHHDESTRSDFSIEYAPRRAIHSSQRQKDDYDGNDADTESSLSDSGSSCNEESDASIPDRHPEYEAKTTATADIDIFHIQHGPSSHKVTITTQFLGTTAAQVAQSLFAGLRDLDRTGVPVIFVEGIDAHHGPQAAAVMNRLRKAADVEGIEIGSIS
ncbi:hypothetical protein MMC25_003317 [Agyrium rufum]|nr:hypothetical protein [Agyrium rufum]